MLDATEKTNGHGEQLTRATDARLVRIERRLVNLAESSEQRVNIVRDATADLLAAELSSRDEEIALLKEQVADLTRRLDQKMVVDEQVHEIATRVEERLAHRDTSRARITDSNFLQSIWTVFAQEREFAREEFKAADEEMQRARGEARSIGAAHP